MDPIYIKGYTAFVDGWNVDTCPYDVYYPESYCKWHEGYMAAKLSHAVRGDGAKTETVTMRDQFAMAALTGMATSAGFQGAPWEALAKDAYEAADAMLKQREKNDG